MKEITKEKQLENQYAGLPNDLKEAKRWICYNKNDKVAMDALTGKKATVDNNLSWTSFQVAINGCVKYGFDGVGFVLGNGMFGIDLDNNEKIMSSDTFKNITEDFVAVLDSFAERSQSGNGVHIICKGNLPENIKNKNGISFFGNGTYFTMTGDVVNDAPISNPESKLTYLLNKYEDLDINSEPYNSNSKTIISTVQANKIIAENNEGESNIDENGDPIIKDLKKSFKKYSLTDTGNAERFYDYFGNLFRFHEKNNVFMFWNNKTWVVDNKGYSKKYADEIIKILKIEAREYEKEIDDATENGASETEIKRMERTLIAMERNIDKVSNSAGKKAMLEEFRHLHNTPVSIEDFNTQEFLLNTDSGVVDLLTGKILPYDPSLMLSKNTNCKVSFEEPKVWLKFLHDIFKREKPEETEELISFVQEALYYSLTGRTNKDKMIILWGDGSNGKSTFMQTVNDIIGEYSKNMNSALLLQTNGSTQSSEFAFAELEGARIVITSETAEGKHLDEVTIKQATSGEELTAQRKYGQPFSFKPRFIIWMSTNNKPIIRATDFGTWRRLVLVPFTNTFKDEEKDIDMPKKLAAEAPKILGWMIKGREQYEAHKGDLRAPKCVEEALTDYKNEMNVISAYLSQRTQPFAGYRTKASTLYQDYKEWAKNNTEYLMSETKFGKELTRRNFEKIKTRNGIFYIGVKLFSDHTGAIFSETMDEDE